MSIQEYFFDTDDSISGWISRGAHFDPKVEDDDSAAKVLRLEQLLTVIDGLWADVGFKGGIGIPSIMIGSAVPPCESDNRGCFNLKKWIFSRPFVAAGFKDPMDRLLYERKVAKPSFCLDRVADDERDGADDGAVHLNILGDIERVLVKLNIDSVEHALERLKEKYEATISQGSVPDEFFGELKLFCEKFSSDEHCLKSVTKKVNSALESLYLNYDRIDVLSETVVKDIIESYVWNHLNGGDWKYIYYVVEMSADVPFYDRLALSS